MGRKITNLAHQHFEYLPVENKSVCKHCQEVIKGHHATNLKKHLVRLHDFTEEQFAVESDSFKPSSSNQPTVPEINTIKVEMSKEILIDACVELVTVNGRPFSLMSDCGFQKILEPLKVGLARKTKDKQFSLTPESIQKYVSKEANNLKQKIIEEVKNCMVSVKVDGVTRMDRSFLGINIQYTRNDQIVLRTLALKEIKVQHTGENLKRVILDVCNNFEIAVEQIYSITTDNGTNLLKAVKVIASENGEYNIVENESKPDDQGWGENAENIEIIIEDDTNMEDSELQFGQKDLFDKFHENFNDFTNEGPFTSTNLKLKVTGVRCAAHTLHLAIEDALKENKQVEKLILEVRKLVKILRTQTFMYMLRKQQLKKPILDCPTRWGSTFDMIQRLLLFKEFCMEMELTNFNKFKNLSESDWDRIVEVLSALEPA